MWSVILMVLGAFVAGGAISFYQQKFPAWLVILMSVIASALVLYGAWSWAVGVRS